MKKTSVRIRLVLFLSICCAMASCTWKVEPEWKFKGYPEPDWSYETDAVKLYLNPDPQLNIYDAQPHTLHLCVYQLKNPNMFRQLSNDKNGLYELLECKMFDGVANSETITVRPGTDITYTLARAEGAKYIGFVAGYQTLEKERIVKLVEIPVMVKRKDFFWLSKASKPKSITIQLKLGKQQIDTLTRD